MELKYKFNEHGDNKFTSTFALKVSVTFFNL
jgi:hypothetical protein